MLITVALLRLTHNMAVHTFVTVRNVYEVIVFVVLLKEKANIGQRESGKRDKTERERVRERGGEKERVSEKKGERKRE